MDEKRFTFQSIKGLFLVHIQDKSSIPFFKPGQCVEIVDLSSLSTICENSPSSSSASASSMTMISVRINSSQNGGGSQNGGKNNNNGLGGGSSGSVTTASVSSSVGAEGLIPLACIKLPPKSGNEGKCINIDV